MTLQHRVNFLSIIDNFQLFSILRKTKIQTEKFTLIGFEDFFIIFTLTRQQQNQTHFNYVNLKKKFCRNNNKAEKFKKPLDRPNAGG